MDELQEILKTPPTVLVFLRHFGCVFCRQQVAQLRPADDLDVTFVCMESPEDAEEFKKKMRSPHRFVSDPERKLYERYGLQQGSMGQIFNLRTFGKSLRAAIAEGQVHMRPTSDPKQLSGVVILDGQGEILWSRYAQDAAEIVSPKLLREQLARLAENHP